LQECNVRFEVRIIPVVLGRVLVHALLDIDDQQNGILGEDIMGSLQFKIDSGVLNKMGP